MYISIAHACDMLSETTGNKVTSGLSIKKYVLLISCLLEIRRTYKKDM